MSRRPRVEISHTVGGDTPAVELPFVVGVLADLSADNADHLPALADRRFVSVDRETLDRVIAAAAPELRLRVENHVTDDPGAQLLVHLKFRGLADLSPGNVAQQIEPLAVLLGQRAAADATARAAIDQRLGRQLDAVMHHPNFQKLEGTLRGLHYLVSGVETSPTLKLKVLNVNKATLVKDLVRAESFEQTALYDKVYSSEFDTLGGQPFGLLVGDYEFDHALNDVAALTSISHTAAAAQAPFVASAGPSMFGLAGFEELAARPDLGRIFDGAEFAPWSAFRDSADSRYVALTLPRVAARYPYGRNFAPADGFDYEEDFGGPHPASYPWMNAAWAYAVRACAAFTADGWFMRTRGPDDGGRVEMLPVRTVSDGGASVTSPAEVLIPEGRGPDLSELGFLPLVHCPGANCAAFFGGHSCHRYRVNADAGDRYTSQLPYLLCLSRFVIAAKLVARDTFGRAAEPGDVERVLNEWIRGYAADDAGVLSEAGRAKTPLGQCRVGVESQPGNPGGHDLHVHLGPHYQMDLPLMLRLVSALPKPRGG